MLNLKMGTHNIPEKTKCIINNNDKELRSICKLNTLNMLRHLKARLGQTFQVHTRKLRLD